MRPNAMADMGREALEKAAAWLREAETCYGLGGHGGVAELIREQRAALDALPLLAPQVGTRLRAPAHA